MPWETYWTVMLQVVLFIPVIALVVWLSASAWTNSVINVLSSRMKQVIEAVRERGND